MENPGAHFLEVFWYPMSWLYVQIEGKGHCRVEFVTLPN
jgi:hypothetical protein